MVSFFTTVLGIFIRLIHLSITFIPFLLFIIGLHTRDLIYSIANLFFPSRRVGSVVPPGHPGHRGVWPQYIAPTPGIESRSPCPGLNSLANHDILPRDGRHITYKQMSHAIQHAYNLAPSLADQLTASAVQLDQGRGWIDLHDLNALNVIQHDASFTRPDIAFCADQSFPDPDLVDRFLAHASNGTSLSLDDIAYFSGLRRAECKRTNGQYSLTWSFLHEFFGSGNGALMYSIFGGDVKNLRVWLAEGRFLDGWEPKTREALGHTIAQAQITSLAIEFNINEKQKLRPGDTAYLKPNGA
ncbi:Chloroperoxidase [Ilyonectria destructans]|nr:Chloroperoxidase [Ilyonectria destructans]